MLYGIDLGGTRIKIAAGKPSGELVDELAIDTVAAGGPDDVTDRMIDATRRLSRRVGEPATAVGVGVHGLVAVRRGVTKLLVNFPTRWIDHPLGERLSGALGCPVRLLNDVRTATLGELRFGYGRGRPDLTMAFFSLGTGVGGGVVVDGNLRLGPLGAAGELGHQTIVPDGPACGCGNRGCLEAVAGGPALVAEGSRLMRTGAAPRLAELCGGDVAKVSPRLMSEAAAGDAAVDEYLDRVVGYIGVAAANVATVLHPDAIVFGGGIAAMGDRLLDGVRTTLRRRVGMFPAESVDVVASSLGGRAGVVGAVALAALASGSTSAETSGA